MAAITFQQAGVFGVCLDIGGRHAGSMVGLMNTSAQVGGFLSSIAYGYIVQRFHSYDAPFVPMAAALFLVRCSGSESTPRRKSAPSDRCRRGRDGGLGAKNGRFELELVPLLHLSLRLHHAPRRVIDDIGVAARG